MGQKPRFLFETDFKVCSRTRYQQSEKNSSIYRDSPTCPPNLVNFSPEMAENGWRDFAHPSLTAWNLYNRQQANFGTCYLDARSYSLEQQNAGRAHAGFAMHLVIHIMVHVHGWYRGTALLIRKCIRGNCSTGQCAAEVGLPVSVFPSCQRICTRSVQVPHSVSSWQTWLGYRSSHSTSYGPRWSTNCVQSG